MTTRTEWLEAMITAMDELGGQATLKELNRKVAEIRGVLLSENNEAKIRQVLYFHSSDSKVFQGNLDAFYHIGKGTWGLRDFNNEVQIEEDIGKLPGRIPTTINRIIRNTKRSRIVKILHKNYCQICNTTVPLTGDLTYSEAHHIKPLGTPHNGQDSLDNIIVLCPNHHVQCDYGAILLNLDLIRNHVDHEINQKYINYHNNIIYKGNYK